MSQLFERIRRAREAGELGVLLETMPYAQSLGLQLEVREGQVRGVLRHAPDHVGNPHVPALHGGVLGALLETTSMVALLASTETESMPRIISITIEYHRPAAPADTFARAQITRQGRRIATVRTVAWQDDPDSPVAMAGAQFLLAV